MYDYVKRVDWGDGMVAAHRGHSWEEWAAYVSDRSTWPEWVSGDDCGIVCHTCEVIIVEVVE